MSAKQVTGVFAIAILIALIGPSGAQDAGAALDVAKAASPALVERWGFHEPELDPGLRHAAAGLRRPQRPSEIQR